MKVQTHPSTMKFPTKCPNKVRIGTVSDRMSEFNNQQKTICMSNAGWLFNNALEPACSESTESRKICYCSL